MNLIKVTNQNFCGVNCNFFRREGDGEIFMTREQIGKALEYSEPVKSIENIHKRHQERMNRFSTVISVNENQGGRNARRSRVLYSPKGIYEICRWSQQPKADAFMDFVWDVLEKIRTGEIGYVNNGEIINTISNVTAKVIEEMMPNIVTQLLQQTSADTYNECLTERRKRRTFCKIEYLPEAVIEDIEGMIINGVTYKEVSQYLKGLGYDISLAAVGRYALNAGLISQRKFRY